MLPINIPIYRPSLSGNEKKYVNECLDSSWISSRGEFIPRFEHAFAKAVECKYAASVCNGTVALHLALVVLGIGPGDEVIVPTLTYIASVNAIRYVGATPVFVDSVRETWQADPADIAKKVTRRTRAIMLVHLYGHPCDLDPVVAIAREHGLFLIEDAAEGFGTRYKGKHVASFGDIAAFSFFGNKTITTGEGGMVVTNDATLYDRAVHFKGQGLARHRQYWHDVVGYNYRMTNICAAIGLAQLERAEQLVAQKRQLASWYDEALADLPVECHREAPYATHSFWMYSILVRDASLRDGLRDHLASAGVETRPVFSPVHTMPMYSERYQRHATAESIGWRGINLPSWPGLQRDEVAFIAAKIGEFLKLSSA